MKRIALLVLGLALALPLSGCGEEKKPPDGANVLRYDGIYCLIRDFDNDGLTNNYALRFYEDGTVIHASVEQKKKNSTYFPSTSWFSRDSGQYADLLGSYELSGGSIKLRTFSSRGSVDYQGTVMEDKLMLDSKSNVNGVEFRSCEYVFYAFDQLSD